MSNEPLTKSPERLRIFKYEALGNTYLVVDPRHGVPNGQLETVNAAPALKKAAVQTLCNVATGVGSNGLLFGPLLSSATSRFTIRVINSDGTFSGFSGNGTRIFARYLLDVGDVCVGTSFEIEVLDEKTKPNIASVQIGSGNDPVIAVTAPQAPRFGVSAVGGNAGVIVIKTRDSASFYAMVPPLKELGAEITGFPDAWGSSTLVDIGNPHCVTFVRESGHLPTPNDFVQKDAKLRAVAFRPKDMDEAVFAAGVNLQWAWVESRTRLHIMIYERGEGPTPASGSSASAAACAAFARGLVERKVDVLMPGGTLPIQIAGEAHQITSVTLIGSAKRISEGWFRLGSA